MQNTHKSTTKQALQAYKKWENVINRHFPEEHMDNH